MARKQKMPVTKTIGGIRVVVDPANETGKLQALEAEAKNPLNVGPPGDDFRIPLLMVALTVGVLVLDLVRS